MLALDTNDGYIYANGESVVAAILLSHMEENYCTSRFLVISHKIKLRTQKSYRYVKYAAMSVYADCAEKSLQIQRYNNSPHFFSTENTSPDIFESY